MKKVPFKKIVAFVAVGLLLFISNGYAQIESEKGVTSTGKEVDCSTIDPSVDKTVNEYGKIVTHPRVTRNGKLITTECSTCGVELSITDTVTCVSITLNAAITAGDPTAAVLKVYSDAAHNTQVGSDITATISGGEITAVASDLNCHTRYYFVLEATDASGICTFDWTDSTRDMSFENLTTCTVGSVRALGIGTDLSHEHGYNGSTTEIDSVYDHEGNAYAVVQIGEQCWLKENMRCTTSPNGHLQEGNSDWVFTPRYYQPSTVSVSQYGYLYNWAGAIDVVDGSAVTTLPANHRGICPMGWHVPDTTEWITLINFIVGTSTSYHYYNGYNFYADNTPIATILAGSCDWLIPANVTNRPGDYTNNMHNSYCFNLLPCPNYYQEGSYNEVGKSCYLWSSNSLNESKAARFSLHYSQTGFGTGDVDNASTPYKQAGRNVRCVRDVAIPEMSVCEDTTFGTVTLKEIKNAEKIEFIQNGSVVKTILNPDSAVFVNDLAQGTYKVKATSSTGDTLVDNARIKHTYTHCTVGALRANEMGATTTQLDSVRDHQNNWYEVVQIGNQCWLKENMRCTTSPSTGSKIMMNKIFSYSSKSAACYDNDSTKYSQYGVLYNWCAAVDTFYAANGEPELANHVDTIYWSCDLSTPRRGVCPEGWHVPTDDEWHVLELNVITDYDTYIDPYVGAFNGKRAGRLAVGCDWDPEGALTTAPGNYSYTERNLSGFSARPTGVYYQGFADFGWSAIFWSATNPTDMEAYSRTLFSDLEGVRRQSNGRQDGFSVRCVRDN